MLLPQPLTLFRILRLLELGHLLVHLRYQLLHLRDLLVDLSGRWRRLLSLRSRYWLLRKNGLNQRGAQ